MSMKPIRPGERELEQKQKKRLQRRVLQHLKHHGPIHFDNLVLLFDPCRTGVTGQAVQALQKRHEVKIDRDRMVQITTEGLRHLEEHI